MSYEVLQLHSSDKILEIAITYNFTCYDTDNCRQQICYLSYLIQYILIKEYFLVFHNVQLTSKTFPPWYTTRRRKDFLEQ